MEINVCKNNHYFIGKEECPYCGEKVTTTLKALKGDCIACGQLCPSYAYACNIPNEVPTVENDSEEFIIK